VGEATQVRWMSWIKDKETRGTDQVKVCVCESVAIAVSMNGTCSTEEL
jgi:hypothetical protein